MSTIDRKPAMPLDVAQALCDAGYIDAGAYQRLAAQERLEDRFTPEEQRLLARRTGDIEATIVRHEGRIAELEREAAHYRGLVVRMRSMVAALKAKAAVQ